MATKKINFDKHIWEGWCVSDFITELEPSVRELSSNGFFKSKEQMKKWVISNQPFYKRYIPDVFNYFYQKYGNGIQ